MPGTNFLRTFMKFFTNLTPSQEKELERALVEAQDFKEITSLETSIKLLKRKVDQRLPIPVLTVKPTIRGAVIEWAALTDQRVNFYEVDVSNQSNFASFDTFPTFGITIVIDGLTETNFARVRGVRNDGTTTPYSEVIPIIPNLFDVTAHVDQAFYVPIVGDSIQTVLGGPGSSLEYIPINPNGNSKVWGMISMYSDPAVAMFGLDQILVSVVSKILDSDGAEISETTVWRQTFGEFYETHTIGPFVINHPELGQTVQLRVDVQDRTTEADGSERTWGDASEIFWIHLNVLELGI